jgi:hypothetical protein
MDAVIGAPNSEQDFKKIFVSGVGFFSDAYDLFIINVVMLILSRDFMVPLH